MHKKYVVRLTAKERENLEALVRRGRAYARRLLYARILLKADASEDGPAWTDERIAEALETSTATGWPASGGACARRGWRWR